MIPPEDPTGRSGLPVLDASQIQSLLDLGAEPGLALELIDLYAADMPLRLAALAAAQAEGDAERVMMEAHQLKGAAGNLGLLRLADLARRLEDAGRAGRLGGLGPLLAALPEAQQEALAALRTAFPG